MASDHIDIGKELVAIKKLLILALASSGMKQAHIAAALDIDRTGVGRMFPRGAPTGFKEKGGVDGRG